MAHKPVEREDKSEAFLSASAQAAREPVANLEIIAQTLQNILAELRLIREDIGKR